MPAAALPLGEVELTGAHLGPSSAFGPPAVLVDGQPAQVLMSRPSRLAFRVPEQAATGLIEVRNPAGVSNAAPLRVARQLTDGLHPVTSPAVSRSGMIYATISGPRGKQTPVSVVRISPDGRGTPFVTGILNATGLAFNPDGDSLSPRAPRATSTASTGRASPPSTPRAWAWPPARPSTPRAISSSATAAAPSSRSIPQRQIFVHATLEPSVAAYHLAVDAAGTLFVTGPTLSSNDAIWAIEPTATPAPGSAAWAVRRGWRSQRKATSMWPPASMAGAAWCASPPEGEAALVLAGANLVGVAFSPLGTTILATNDAVYDVDLGVEGLNLF